MYKPLELAPTDTRVARLIPAAFTPMQAGGKLNLGQVAPLVEHLIRNEAGGIFVCGSTGEFSSLTSEERRMTAEAFVDAAGGRVPVIIHVGHNSLEESRRLAAHAQQIGADAIAAAPPSYDRPASIELLVKSLQQITLGAPDLSFYYYHIPRMTGVYLDMLEFLRYGGERLPSLAGIKYTQPTVHEFQLCAEHERGRFEILFGTDEMLLSGLCAGATGAVGSTYNFAAPVYRRIVEAFADGNLPEARRWQAAAARMIDVINRHRSQPGFKAVMNLIGIDCGPNRLPLDSLKADEIEILRSDLDQIGFFGWIQANEERTFAC